MVTLKLRFPAPSSALIMNLLGVLGLAGLAVAIGGLTHNIWWALLVGATECVGLSVVAAMNVEDDTASMGDEVISRPRAA